MSDKKAKAWQESFDRAAVETGIKPRWNVKVWQAIVILIILAMTSGLLAFIFLQRQDNEQFPVGVEPANATEDEKDKDDDIYRGCDLPC